MSVYLYACMLICMYVYSVYMYGGVCKYAHYVKVICHMYTAPVPGGPGVVLQGLSALEHTVCVFLMQPYTVSTW